MYFVYPLKNYKKSLNKIIHSGKIQIEEVDKVVEYISLGRKLPEKHKDHSLKGEWKGYRECHIRPDVLLIYQKQEDKLILLLINIGSHSELFS